MISHEITLLPVTEIAVDWSLRYPRDSLDENLIEALADDIQKNDLIHTILVEKKTNRLLVGGHRLAAWLRLRAENRPCPNLNYQEWKKIPVRIAFNILPGEAELIELVENIKRRQLPWNIRAEQVVKIHEGQASKDRKWTSENTAAFIGCSATEVRQSVRIVKYLDSPELSSALEACTTLNAAFNVVIRNEDRTKADHMEALLKAPGLSTSYTMPVKKAEVVVPKEQGDFPFPMILSSFEEFSSSYNGPKFNFFHCDPPYGVKIGNKKRRMKSRVDLPSYDDQESDLEGFMETLAVFCRQHAAASAHMMLWYSQMQEEWLLAFLQKEMSDWHLQEFRMIWHYVDGAGIVPDSQRYGRRNYETAFCLTRGDRLIIKPVELCFGFAKSQKSAIHKSQKHRAVCHHFMSMFVDKHSICIDPTAGSGAPLQAMQLLGAQHIVGIEKNSEIFSLAKEDWNTFCLELPHE